MALVSYDYESGSDHEEDDSLSSSQVVINSISKSTANVEVDTNHINDNNKQENATSEVPELLSQLPKSLTQPAVNTIEDNIEDFVPKYKPTTSKEKKPQKTKIMIPSLAEFEEEDDQPQPKKKKQPSKGSGLLSLLPPIRGTPLSTISFVPKVLKSKSTTTDKNNTLLPNAVRKRAELAKTAAIRKISKLGNRSDAESDDDIETPETFDDEMWQKVCGRRTKPPKPQVPQEFVEAVVVPTINIAPEPIKPYDGLDNAAFKELVGKSKRPVNIKLVDINEEEILPDKNTLTKSLTDPDAAPPVEIEDPCDPTRKKKHHITYLAEQAKANEHELASQWSTSKYARNQTRAKYGF